MTARRKHIPLKVQLYAALLQLGLEPTDAQLDHHPALGLRPWDDEASDTSPAANDPRYLVWRPSAQHRTKTFGSPATVAGSDIHAIAKAKRLAKKQETFRRSLLGPDRHTTETTPPSSGLSRPWPKGRKIQSRGFQKRERQT